MGPHKHIEKVIGRYIASRYHSCAEIGVGRNFETALTILNCGGTVLCTDIRYPDVTVDVPFRIDDLYAPDFSLYRDVEVIYSLRPGEEMMPSLIRLAQKTNSDLIVYHLGFEIYGDGGELLDCSVVLRRYHRSQKPSKRVF